VACLHQLCFVYLHQAEFVLPSSCLFISLRDNLKNCCQILDDIIWRGVVCDQQDLIRFGWSSGALYDKVRVAVVLAEV